MNESVFIGTYPGLSAAMLNYVITTVTKLTKTLGK